MLRATGVVLLSCLAASGVAGEPGDLPIAVPQRWTPPVLSSGQYESSPVFSPDGREIFFFRAPPSFDRYRLLSSQCDDGRWSLPREPAFAGAADALETDPAYSRDGAWVYYASDRANKDDLDIWRVQRHVDGRFGEPERLPAPVNSPQTELLPRPLPDGRLLFGSHRPGGAGGRDLYIATPRVGGGWDVAPLPAPVNTAADEYEADLARDGPGTGGGRQSRHPLAPVCLRSRRRCVARTRSRSGAR